MSNDFEEIEDSALKLDQYQRATLANSLFHSVHGSVDSEIEHAWLTEIERRLYSLESGEASLHSLADVLKEARSKLNS
jgi:hypothetical protein